MKVNVANESKRNKNKILKTTENMYGYRKKKQPKKPSIKPLQPENKTDIPVTESVEIERINENKRKFYRKIGCLVELDSSNFSSKNTMETPSKQVSGKMSRTRPNKSERVLNQREVVSRRNFQSGRGKKSTNKHPRFKAKPMNNIRKAPPVAKTEKAQKETAEERRERIKAYKKMRFVGLKSKQKKEQSKQVSKTTPININKSPLQIYTPNRDFSDTNLSGSKSSQTPTPEITPERCPDVFKTPSIKEDRLSASPQKPKETQIDAIKIETENLKDEESAEKTIKENRMNIIEEQKQKIIRMSREEMNIEIQSCRIERNVEKMMFETGSVKNGEEAMNEEISDGAELDILYPGSRFPTGLRSPSDMSHDFRSESASRLKLFEDVPISMQSNEKNLNIEDLRNFHKKGNDQRDVVGVNPRKIYSMQDNLVQGDRRLTLRENENSSEIDLAKFKKNYSNAQLPKTSMAKPKEDFLDPKFDSAIPRITRMIQGKAEPGLGGSESLEFLLTRNAGRTRGKMLDMQELTSDMDMIINGIDSLILTKPPGGTLRSKLSEATGNLEYTKTQMPRDPSNQELTKILESQKEVTNLVIEEMPQDSRISHMNDEEIQQMKKDLNLKGDTQDVKDFLVPGNSTVVNEKHPFLKSSTEVDRAELRQSLEKYAANLERIEEESGQREESYVKERALKFEEDPYEQSIKFEVTRDAYKRSQKPPLLKVYFFTLFKPKTSIIKKK